MADYDRKRPLAGLVAGRGATDIRTSLDPFDMSGDGQRFLLLKTNARADAAANRIDVVLNWPTELQRVAPAGKK